MQLPASSKTLAIIGSNGGLAQAISKKFQNQYQTQCFGKDQYNFTNQQDIDSLAKDICNFDIVINCAGVFEKNSWETLLINTVAPARLIEQMTKLKSNSHLILVGSHAGTWTSWPGIDLKRLWYNISKQTLESITLGCEHSHSTNLKFTLINFSKFQTTMSNFSGYNMVLILDTIKYIIESPLPPLVYEFPSYNG